MLRTTVFSLLLLSNVLFADTPQFVGTVSSQEEGVLTVNIQTSEPFETVWLWVGDQAEVLPRVRSVRDVDFYSFQLPLLTLNSKRLDISARREDQSEISVRISVTEKEVSFDLRSDRSAEELEEARLAQSKDQLKDLFAKIDSDKLEAALKAIEIINEMRADLKLSALEIDYDLCLKSHQRKDRVSFAILPGASSALRGAFISPDRFAQMAWKLDGYLKSPNLKRIGFSFVGGELFLELAGDLPKKDTNSRYPGSLRRR